MMLCCQAVFSENLEEAMVKAANNGDATKVRKLLDQGESANSKHRLTGWSALIAACYSGQIDVVRMLIQAGADVNARDKTGGTPLFKAATVRDDSNIPELLNRKAQIIRELLKAGADPQLQDNFGGTPWEQAIINNHQELIIAFEGVKGVKETQMIVAASTGNVSVVKKMIEEGADVN
jgi:ankyrin repeat protein